MYIRPLVALVSYGYIVFLYIQALVNPLDHIDFMYGFGMFIFIAEFLSIHSSAMLTGINKIRQALLLTAFYMIFAVAFSVALGTYYPALILVLSIAAKATLSAAPEVRAVTTSITHDKNIIGTVFIFVGTATFVALFGWIITAFISFPEAVYAAKPANASGLFVDTPQVLLVWGVLYYSVLIVWQVGGTFRKALSASQRVSTAKTRS